jgi:hypothetical protein
MSWDEDVRDLRLAGGGEPEIMQLQDQQTQEFLAAGADQATINGYFGRTEPKIAPEVTAKVKENMAAAPVPEKAPAGEPHPAQGILDSFQAGLQMSVFGLAARQAVPDITLPENATWGKKLAYNSALWGADLLPMFVGGAGGGVVGGAVGVALGSEGTPLLGAVVGAGTALAGAGAGAFALPAFLRKGLMDHYQKGDIKDFGEFFARLAGATKDAMKEGVTGAATSLTGGAVGAAGGGLLVRSAAEVGAMVTVGQAMEGKVPTAQDFADAAVMVGAMHLAGAGYKRTIADPAAKLRAVYALADIPPGMVVERAQQSPELLTMLHEKGDNSAAIAEHLNDIPASAAVEEPQVPALDGQPPESLPSVAAENADTMSPKFSPPAELRTEQPENYEDPIDYEEFRVKESTGDHTTAEEPQTAPEQGPSAERTVFTPEEAAAEIRSRVNRDIPTPPAREWKARFQTAWRSFYKNVYDRLQPILDLERDFAGKWLEPAEAKAYARLRLMSGTFDKAVEFIEGSGPRNFKTGELVEGAESLKAILRETPDPKVLGEYGIALRAMEKKKQGVETGINWFAADQFVKDNKATYDPLIKRLQKYQDGVVQYLIDSGVVAKEDAKRFRAANKEYVPFHRLLEETSGAAYGRDAQGNPIKVMEGSTRFIIDPLESIIKNTHMYVRLADANAVKGELVARMAATENGKELFQKITPDEPAKKASPGIATAPEDIQRILDAAAKEGQDFGGLDAEKLAPFTEHGLRADEIRYYNDGKVETYKTSREVASILNGTDQQQLPDIFRLLSFPAKLERAGIVDTLSFAVRHGLRNPFKAMFYTRNNLLPWDILEGVGSYLKKDSNFRDAMAGGLGNRLAEHLDRTYFQEDIFKLSKETGLMDTVLNAVKSPLQTMHAVTAIMDNSIRMAEFIKARRGGKNITTAAFDARSVVPDASRAGLAMRAITSTVPFFHMEWQGLEMFARTAATNPGRFAVGAAGIAATSMAVWALGKGDSRIDDIPDYQKDLFWCVPTDDWRPVDQADINALTLAMTRPEDQRREYNGQLYTNEGTVYRIPKPFQAGVLFGSGTERALDAFYTERPDAFRGFGAALLSGVARTPIPAFAKPIIEQFANKSTFTGNPIVPESVMHELPEYRYTDATSEPAKLLAGLIPKVPFIGRSIAISPMVIDNYIRSYTGDVGAFVLNVASGAVGAGHELPVGHPLTAPGLGQIGSLEEDVPFVRSFVVRHPSGNSRSIEAFQDSAKEYQQFKATLQERLKDGDTGAADQLATMQDLEFRGVDLGGAQKAIQVQAHAIRLIFENKDMTPIEKRQQIDGLYYMMAATAKTANETLRRARAAVEGQ